MQRRKVLARIVRSAVERLEARMLMSSTLAATAGTASITGVVYNDINGNGIRDAGEPAAPNVTVTLSEVGVIYAPGTVPSVQADINGGFAFTGLAAGQYDVALVPDVGTIQDVPGTVAVTVNTNDTVSVAVGETSSVAGGGSGIGKITGTLFNDVNQSGVYVPITEDFLAGDTVFLDLNGSGVQNAYDPIAITNSVGQYTFSVAPGSYQVRVVPRPGFHADPPGFSQVTVYSGQTVSQNIGENNHATISGTLYVDANGNGIQDPGEIPVAGDTVFLDENYDGVLEPGTYNPKTGGFVGGDAYTTTDANGFFSLTGLTTGTYRVVVQSAVGLVQDTPGYIDVNVIAGQNLIQNVGEGAPSSFNGTVFDDRNGNGTLQPGEPGLPNQLVYLDNNTNGVYDQTGIGSNGLPEIGPMTTYTVPANANVLLDGLPATIDSLFPGDTTNLTLVAGGTTIISSIAASDLPVPTNQSNPAVGTGPSGTITDVTLNPITVQLTLTADGKSVANVQAIDRNNVNGILGAGPGPLGSVVAVDLNGNNITLEGAVGAPATYPLAAGATVILDGAVSSLAAFTLGTITVQAAEPASVTDANGNFTFANLGPGTYTARVVVPQGAIPSGPANATHSFTFTVTSGETITDQNFGFLTPDLTANILKFPTTPVLTGVTKKATVRITDVGSLPDIGLAGVTLWAQLDSGVVNTPTAFLIGTLPGRSVKLQVGQSKTLTIYFSYPTQLQQNSYYVSAQVVSAVHDNNSANDFSPPVGAVQVGPPYVDLSIAYAANPQLIVDPGQSTPISLVVTNLGNVTTSGTISFRLYITTTATIEPTDIVVHVYNFKNPRIKPGRSKVFNLTVPYPGQNLGSRFINWDVDSGDSLGETNLLNNILIEPYETRFD